MNNIYAGIGSRSTPPEICAEMALIAAALAEEGITLRSGAAKGADSAFERGCDMMSGPKEIFIPWYGFNGQTIPAPQISKEAMDLAAVYHPAWDYCSPAAKRLHARNCYQILGLDLHTPVDAVICWTPGGGMQGGTAQALRIAMDHKIHILNFGSLHPDAVWEQAAEIWQALNAE